MLRHIFEPLIRRAGEEGDATFCHFIKNGQAAKMTVSEVVTFAHRCAARLKNERLPVGGVILIVIEHRWELYPAFIGATLAGLIPSFLPPMTRKQDSQVFARSMRALVERIAPAAIVVSDATHKDVPLDGQTVIAVSDLVAGSINLPGAEIVTAPGGLAFLQHSSGTTGLKKGVLLSHAAVAEQANSYAAAIGLTKQDIVASWLPLYHDMGLIAAFIIPAIVGCPIVSFDALEWVVKPTLLLEYVEQFRATACWLPNFAFYHISRLDDRERTWTLGSLRLIVNCSEPCRSQAFDRFLEHYKEQGLRPEVLQVSYAMAENVFAVTQTTPGMIVRRGPSNTQEYLSCGRTLPGVELMILDEKDLPVTDGVVGRIFLRSPHMFQGYFKDVAKTAEACVDGWYRTGDLGFMDRDELFVVGRYDDVVVVNGKNILAHEIEDAINEVTDVLPGRVLLFGLFNSDAGANQLVVLAEWKGGQHRTEREVTTEIRRLVLASCGIYPHAVRLLSPGFLVKSTSGKISRVESIRKFEAVMQTVGQT